jgi:DNA-binding NarL/FixJ family response regulator
MWKILICDDHQLFSEGLESIIATMEDIEVIGKAKDGEAALAMIKTRKPDLILLDVNLPGRSGWEVCNEIKQKNPEIKVLIVTMFSEPAQFHRSRSAGADGFIVKNSERNELIHAIKEILDGRKYFSIPPNIGGNINPVTGERGFNPSNILRISRREKEILVMVCQGLTSQQIAANLHLSTYTVDTHRKNMMHKLGVKNVAELILAALNSGLLTETKPKP